LNGLCLLSHFKKISYFSIHMRLSKQGLGWLQYFDLSVKQSS